VVGRGGGAAGVAISHGAKFGGRFSR
jgi:hypothetical protein